MWEKREELIKRDYMSTESYLIKMPKDHSFGDVDATPVLSRKEKREGSIAFSR